MHTISTIIRVAVGVIVACTAWTLLDYLPESVSNSTVLSGYGAYVFIIAWYFGIPYAVTRMLDFKKASSWKRDLAYCFTMSFVIFGAWILYALAVQVHHENPSSMNIPDGIRSF